MRILLLLLTYNAHVLGFFGFSKPSPGYHWKGKHRSGDELTGYRKGVSVTGRVFVTMFGYPSKCERKGVSHSCTLSFACWLVGGSSQSGCGASPWIVACCVTSKKSQSSLDDLEYSDDSFDSNLKAREESFPVLQKRIDDFEEEDICGLSSERMFSKRIIGGREAAFGQYPWQAYIKIATYQCGGVLGTMIAQAISN
ncbi:uncharacterized protein LOC108913613 [Anoplophora glabripennis]|uniref:uncharacterized protein LOC108913613 n=1 Tax=Anoplophora glabripennis TaxID=217634 RepID=UPI0008756530|nr:uncharacterized protein LOC108913613 [Anoplophora glabripennis]